MEEGIHAYTTCWWGVGWRGGHKGEWGGGVYWLKRKGRGGEGEDIFMKEGVLLVMGTLTKVSVYRKWEGSYFKPREPLIWL